MDLVGLTHGAPEKRKGFIEFIFEIVVTVLWEVFLQLVSELLFEFEVDGARYRCELMDHGPHGVEVAITHSDGEYLNSRMFHPSLTLDQSPRDMAIASAMAERDAMEKGTTCDGGSREFSESV